MAGVAVVVVFLPPSRPLFPNLLRFPSVVVVVVDAGVVVVVVVVVVEGVVEGVVYSVVGAIVVGSNVVAS